MRLSSKKLRIVTFKIEPEILAEFDVLARSKGLLRSELIRMLIVSYIHKHGKSSYESSGKSSYEGRLRFIE